MSTAHWYAVHTKPRAEEQARAALEHKGICVYLPRVKVARVNPRARPVVPLFPGYLFVNTDLEQVGQSAINRAPGVVSLVSFGSEPVLVPEPIIEHVKQRLIEVQRRDELGLGPFRTGERVRITSGPLRDLDAVFDQPLSAKGRAPVLIEFLGRITAAEVDLAALDKIVQRARTSG